MAQMKNLVYLLVIPILSVAFGCTREDMPASQTAKASWSASLTDNFVGIGQIKAYVDREKPASKADAGPTYAVIPYCGSEGDTLMYIVNYGNGDGWQIFSSDARTPAVIAEGESGSFSVENGSPAVQVWLECTAADISAVRGASDEDLAFSADEIEANLSKWNIHKPRVIPDPEGDGHWVTQLVSAEEYVYDTLGHITPHWVQIEPYNSYCPLKSNSNTLRAPAGCVAVSAAQVLYYLHNKLGVPETMMSEGVVNGNVLSYTQVFSSPSSAVWAQMDSTYQSAGPADKEAIMIGHIGKTIGMSYGNNSSMALLDSLDSSLFAPYGITCSHLWYYSTATIKSNLINRIPVIVGASDNNYSNSHCFVIDGYKRTRTRYYYYHYWVYDNPDPWNPKWVPNHDPYYTSYDSNPEVKYIKINWGWPTQWGTPAYNDGWFSITANWVVNGNITYNHVMETIQDFGILSE